MSDKVLIDIAVLAKLGKGSNNRDFLIGLIDKYKELMASGLEDMTGALDEGDLQAFRKLAHKLRGSSAYVGAVLLQAEFLRLYQLSDYQLLAQKNEIPGDLTEIFTTTMEALKRYLNDTNLLHE